MYESKEKIEKLYGATMTINEVLTALISMPPYTKFSHPYFNDDEYLYRNTNNEVLLGARCNEIQCSSRVRVRKYENTRSLDFVGIVGSNTCYFFMGMIAYIVKYTFIWNMQIIQ